jgi:hypothetical protein
MNTCRITLITCLTLGLFFLLSPLVPAVGAQETEAGIQKMMTPEEYSAAGLNKLSPEERQKLDAWLHGYREAAETKAAEKATEKAAKTSRAKMDIVASRVDGTLGGLTGRTVIKLEDGTKWKQGNSDDRYRPSATDHPNAVVVHTPFGYKMHIEGMAEFYVNPVRSQ